MPWRLEKVGGAEIELRLSEIVGKQRPRTNYAQRRTYTPAKTERFEATVADEFREMYGSHWADFDGEVRMTVWSSRELAKSNPKYWEGRADLGKPDADNIAKIVADALNGVAYKDDSQITTLNDIKMPRTRYGLGCSLRVVIEYYKETYERCR